MRIGIDIGGSSIKGVALIGDQVQAARSTEYASPDERVIGVALRQVLDQLCVAPRPGAIGLSVPGQMHKERTSVRRSANIPALNDLDLRDLVCGAIGAQIQLKVLSDALSAAIGSYRTEPVSGKLLCLSLGTGVGASLLRDGSPVTLDGSTVGHIGQMDVSLDDDAAVGPDGGRGSLEAYIGLPALRDRFGDVSSDQLTRAIETLGPHDPEIRALARAIRVAHAVYTPDHVRLLGGVGIALGPCVPAIRDLVNDRLTSVASPDWTLSACDDPYLAAIGAAVFDGDPS